MVGSEPLTAAQWDAVGLADRPTFHDARHMIIYGQRTDDGRHRVRRARRAVPLRVAHRPDVRHRRAGPGDARRRRSASCTRRCGDVEFPYHWGGPLGVPRDWRCGVRYDRAAGHRRRRRLRRRRRVDDEPRRAHARRPDHRPRHRPRPRCRGSTTDSRRVGARTAALARRSTSAAWPPARADRRRGRESARLGPVAGRRLAPGARHPDRPLTARQPGNVGGQRRRRTASRRRTHVRSRPATSSASAMKSARRARRAVVLGHPALQQREERVVAELRGAGRGGRRRRRRSARSRTGRRPSASPVGSVGPLADCARCVGRRRRRGRAGRRGRSHSHWPYVANDSFSHRSAQSAGVTASPNHWWASSCDSSRCWRTLVDADREVVAREHRPALASPSPGRRTLSANASP